MNIVRTGIILNVENYDECVAFYKEVFGLDILFEERDGSFRLTCFTYGGSYLMANTAFTRYRARNPTQLMGLDNQHP
jgi:lactoylglutathione lyase